MSHRPSLRRRLILGLLAYLAILSAVFATHGYWVNERTEQAVWESLLRSEMEFFTTRRAQDPDHFAPNTDLLQFFDGNAPAPVAFQRLAPGVHDELVIGDRQYVVLVEQVSGRPAKRVLALDITDQEQDEVVLATRLGASVALVALLLSALIFFGVGRLIKPLTQLVKTIPMLKPDGRDPPLEVAPSAPSEIALMTDALNGYSQRIRDHIEREKEFINLASHELRTPIAVITNAMQVALEHEDTADTVRPYLERAHRTSVEMTELSNMLLALARDPARIQKEAREIDLAEELPSIIEDHTLVASNKELAIQWHLKTPILVDAPPQVVRAVISNLLRNAIENSDRGTILIQARGPETLAIQDPGHGMSGEEMSALYTRLTRGGMVRSGGIGLGLIARLCQHFGWKLQLDSQVQGGTVASVTFTPGMRPSSEH
ncbi:MAG: two-component sensor histidine kinase [Stenotrophomonas acidaminiphila]|nr:MAG: two-component sensor histidine kinase [Stenotrophomonas acidaminiphila]